MIEEYLCGEVWVIRFQFISNEEMSGAWTPGGALEAVSSNGFSIEWGKLTRSWVASRIIFLKPGLSLRFSVSTHWDVALIQCVTGTQSSKKGTGKKCSDQMDQSILLCLDVVIHNF